MKSLVFRVASPLLCVFIAMVASGFYGTFFPIRLLREGFSIHFIGISTAVYYLGFVIGCLLIAKYIIRVGHIRSYLTFTSLANIALLLQGLMFRDESIMLMTRVIYGFCVSGFFIVIESWLLNCAKPSHKSIYLSLYMIFLYSGQSLGSYLVAFDTYNGSIFSFCIIAILISLSSITLASTTNFAPHIENRFNFKETITKDISSSLAMICVGIINSCSQFMLPVFLQKIGYQTIMISKSMALLIAGAVVFQFPLGKLSDMMDKTKFLMILSVLFFVNCMIIIFGSKNKELLFYLLFILGGISFGLYAILTNYITDVFENKDHTTVVQTIILLYGVGSVIGPMLSPYFDYIFIAHGLIVFLSHIGIALFLLFYFKVKKKVIVKHEEGTTQYVMMPTSQVAGEMDKTAEKEAIKQDVKENKEEDNLIKDTEDKTNDNTKEE